mmetsp:Transcript_67216/g.146259  ORF Transcript_67216/g.146259 Transcript_67216/m.146259 type:complete len:416 (-) Transcript_67216:688-1935(-)
MLLLVAMLLLLLLALGRGPALLVEGGVEGTFPPKEAENAPPRRAREGAAGAPVVPTGTSRSVGAKLFGNELGIDGGRSFCFCCCCCVCCCVCCCCCCCVCCCCGGDEALFVVLLLVLLLLLLLLLVLLVGSEAGLTRFGDVAAAVLGRLLLVEMLWVALLLEVVAVAVAGVFPVSSMLLGAAVLLMLLMPLLLPTVLAFALLLPALLLTAAGALAPAAVVEVAAGALAVDAFAFGLALAWLGDAAVVGEGKGAAFGMGRASATEETASKFADLSARARAVPDVPGTKTRYLSESLKKVSTKPNRPFKSGRDSSECRRTRLSRSFGFKMLMQSSRNANSDSTPLVAILTLYLPWTLSKPTQTPKRPFNSGRFSRFFILTVCPSTLSDASLDVSSSPLVLFQATSLYASAIKLPNMS